MTTESGPSKEENNSCRDLICVKFPGFVKNDDRAVQCLGGLRSISQVYSDSTKRRLGLSFQPENPYVKKIFADAHNTGGVLLKVKVKKTKGDNGVKREVLSTAVLGRVKLTYKFESMCDFQYLAVHTDSAQSHGAQSQCILEKLLPTGLNSFSFLSEQAPVFVVPSNFTRSDKPIPYLYTYKKYGKDMTPDCDDVHRRIRSDRRGLPSHRLTFNLIDEFNTEPNEYYIKQKEEKIKVQPALQEEYELVKKLFDQRPIVSVNYVKYETKVRITSLKVILPCLASNMHGGPWKMLWVKFGYDPRKEPGARIYQTLDFRLRNTPGLQSLVLTRDATVHKFKKADRFRSLKRHLTEEASNSEEISEGAVYFRPGLTPSQRQIYYQYCDVQIPEVQQLLAVEPPPGYLCHPTRGWLPPNTDEICRDHIYKYVKQSLVSILKADLKFEQEGSSDDDFNEGDGSTAAEGEETMDVDETNISS